MTTESTLSTTRQHAIAMLASSAHEGACVLQSPASRMKSALRPEREALRELMVAQNPHFRKNGPKRDLAVHRSRNVTLLRHNHRAASMSTQRPPHRHPMLLRTDAFAHRRAVCRLRSSHYETCASIQKASRTILFAVHAPHTV